MLRLARVVGVVTLLFAHQAAVSGDDEEPKRPVQQTGPVEFNAVKDLAYPLVGPSLMGARIADPKQFTASFYASSASGACTSAMVGLGVLLTAAHCVANNGTIKVRLGAQEWSGTCTHAPDYAANRTADWALCRLGGGGPTVPFEVVNKDAALLKKNDEIQLTGFGCTQPDGSGGNDGIYRIGEAPVSRLPTAGTDHDIVTKAQVALCFGDSGGPAFRYTDPAKSRRVQVGVNSRGNIKDKSYLSSTSTAAAIHFFTSWAEKNNAAICGLHAAATGCRP
jgi:hypothetical protein